MHSTPVEVGAARPRILIAVAAVAVAAAVSITVAARAHAASAHTSAQATVHLRKTGLGNVLVDARGRTLYLFKADKGTKSVCYGMCATYWPPLITTSQPAAGAGVKQGLLGTTKRHDGRLQVTYGGHPLYRFSSDTKAGQTTGENVNHFGGEWYAVSAAGKQVEKPGTTATTPAPATGGGGYGGGYG
jgi:predicted lipoprotein with Yx(FWY)xxD motif